MWIFMPLGLLMPAALPTMEHDHAEADPKWTRDGEFDLQVRARVESHLENFCRDYCDPMGLEHSEIQKTPQMDYNCRMYMRKEDFAKAVARAVEDIDYTKFKPTAERRTADGYIRYEDGKQYHSVLNAIWGTVTRLGHPGGAWSDWGTERRASSSGFRRAYGREQPARSWVMDEGFVGRTSIDSDDEMDYPLGQGDSHAMDIMDRLDGIPESQWAENATPQELEEVEQFMLRNPGPQGNKSRGGRR